MKGRLISLSRGWEVGRRVPRQDLRDYGGRLEWEQWRGEGEMAEERSEPAVCGVWEPKQQEFQERRGSPFLLPQEG